MRKLREVLRLRFELKLGYQQIGRSCAIGVSTVNKYLERAGAAGVTLCIAKNASAGMSLCSNAFITVMQTPELW